MKLEFIVRIAMVLAATAANSLGQTLPGLYFTNTTVLSNGSGQFEVRTPVAGEPFALLASYAKDFSYLHDTARWEFVMPLNADTNRYVFTTPEPMSEIGTIFFRAAPLGQPMYWLEYGISSYGLLTTGLGVVTWPKQPAGWSVELNVQNITNAPVGSNVVFTGPPGTVTKTPAQHTSSSDYACYYDLPGPGTAPPAGIWHVQFATQALTFPMPDPEVGRRYVVMVPDVVVSNGLLTSVSWTYRNAASGAILASVPDYVAGSKSVTMRDVNDLSVYDSPPADRSRTNHVFSSPIVWNEVGSLHIGFHDNLGNTFDFSYAK